VAEGTKALAAKLYAAQEAWRPIRRPAKDKTARNLILFASKALATKPTTKAATAQLARISRKAPQAMLKVSKATYGAKHTFSNFTYISRNGKVPIYDQDGVEITDVEDMMALAQEWHELNFNPDDLDTRAPAPDARRLILSMPKGSDPDIVLQAAAAAARALFEDKYDYIYGLHTDEGKGKSPHPHVHLTVRAKSHEGVPLAFGPDDILYMRRVFATELRERGIDADATPQIMRGAKLNNEHSKTYQARLNVEKNNQRADKPTRTFERDIKRMENGQDRAYYSADVVQLYSELMVELMKSPVPEHNRLGQQFGQFVSYSYNVTFNADGPAPKPGAGGGGAGAIERDKPKI